MILAVSRLFSGRSTSRRGRRFRPPAGAGRGAIVAGTLALASLAGCAALGKIAPRPSARIEDVSIGGVTLNGLTLDFRVAVTNPYSTSLPLVGLEYALASQNKRFLTGDFRANRIIPPRETAVIPMPITLSFGALREAGATVRPGATIPYRADVAIKVDAPVLGILRIPTKKEGTISLPRFP